MSKLKTRANRVLWGAALGWAMCALSACGGKDRAVPMLDQDRGAAVDDLRNAGVEGVLDRLHAAASAADGPAYWACFAPNAVFLGTDAGERWSLDQFKAYAEPLFAKGRGWTYVKTSRTVTMQDERTAWFDELLENTKYGTCRGSGIVVRGGDGVWRIAQYNLSVPIPNDLLEGFAQKIREHDATKNSADTR